MANVTLQPTTITRAALKILHNTSALLPRIDKQYDSSFAQNGGKIGDTLKLRRPVQYTVRSGRSVSIQDVKEYTTDLTVATQRGIDFSFNSDDLTLKIDDFSERYLKPAMARLATELDYIILGNLKSAVGNLVGARGTSPASLDVFLAAQERLVQNACPQDDNLFCVLSPKHMRTSVNALSTLFNASKEISDQYRKGVMGMAAGFEFSGSQNLPVHTVGPLGGTPLVNGASQGITTGWAATTDLVTDGWTAAAAARLKAGDVFTIAGVYAVNPETKQTTGDLRQFVVTADKSSDASGNLTATIAPAIITAGAYQNVNSVPADDAALTILGTASTQYQESIAFHRDAITLVTADMILPKGTDMAARENMDGVSARFIRDYNSTDDYMVSRFDILFGFAFPRSEWAVRITG